jgi:EamA-like transporter family
LTGGCVFKTLGLEETAASNAGFITGLFVVLTPVLGAVFLRQSIPAVAWAATGVAMVGLWLLSGAGTEFRRPLRLAPERRAAECVRLARGGVHHDAIVEVEIIPRFRPPTPLPEG